MSFNETVQKVGNCPEEQYVCIVYSGDREAACLEGPLKAVVDVK